MPENKNQHYVPQFYLKLFTDNNSKFNIFNIESGKTYDNVPYKGQGQKDYFYGKDMTFENKFQDMETEWGPLFQKIMQESELTHDDIYKIKKFVVFQRERTVAASEYGDETKRIQMIEQMKMICENQHIPVSLQEIENLAKEKVEEQKQDVTLSLQLADNFLPYTEDLNLLILTYDTKETLISSDAPVVSVNKFSEPHVGYSTAGFVSFFPVCKNKIAVIYDAKMYTKYKDVLYGKSNDENEVKILNEYQLINAGTIVFGCRDDINTCYTTNVSELRRSNRNRPAVQSIGSNEGKLLVHMPRLSIYPCNLSFATPNRDARRVPEIGRDHFPRIRNQEYVERMYLRKNRLPQVEKALGKRSIEEQKEYKSAIKRMNQYVYKYWGQPVPIQTLK